MWVFPKILGKPPNHPFVHRVGTIIFTIHFGYPYFWKHPCPDTYSIYNEARSTSMIGCPRNATMGNYSSCPFWETHCTMSNAKSHVTALFFFYQENVHVLTSIYQNPAGTILACIRDFHLEILASLWNIKSPKHCWISGPNPLCWVLTFAKQGGALSQILGINPPNEVDLFHLPIFQQKKISFQVLC